jgi:hypothetical protein
MRTASCRNAWLSKLGSGDGTGETMAAGRNRIRRRADGPISHSGSNVGKYPALDAPDVPRKYCEGPRAIACRHPHCGPKPLLAVACICDALSNSNSVSNGSGLKRNSLFTASLLEFA